VDAATDVDTAETIDMRAAFAHLSDRERGALHQIRSAIAELDLRDRDDALSGATTA